MAKKVNMEAAKVFMKDLASKAVGVNPIFKRNLLKEYLQILALDFVYTHPLYNQLIFYGGSCLKHCYGLPRLSEDLDFVDGKGKVKVERLAKEAVSYFRKNTDLKVSARVQKFRVYLKFPILRELNLASASESDLLFLKIEVFPGFRFSEKNAMETMPLFKFNKSILVRTFNLPTLMSTKIWAILHRQWQKTNKNGRTLVKVKGRDYFDLLWYLRRGVKPNLNLLPGCKSYPALAKKLTALIDKVDARSIRRDLEALIEDYKFVQSLSRGLKAILKKEISSWEEVGKE